MCITFAIIFLCVLVTVDASLYDFTQVGECILGYNPWFDLLRHGCYCGFGNYGNVSAEDGYDECCMRHDECYGNLTDSKPPKCPSVLAEYLFPYWFVCEPYTNVYCYVDPPFSWFPHWEECGVGLCNCDRDMMLCWKNQTKKPGDRPDKRYCNRTKLPLPQPHDPTWMDYFENTVMFYKNNYRLQHEKAEEERRRMEILEERTNQIQEGMKGNRRYPIIKRAPDDIHIEIPPRPYLTQESHPLPQQQQWHHRPRHPYESPDFYDD